MIKIISKKVPKIMHQIFEFISQKANENDLVLSDVEDWLYKITTKGKTENLDSDLSFFKLSYNHDLSDKEFNTILLYLSIVWGMYLEIRQGTYQKNKKRREKGLLKRQTSPPLSAFEYQGASPNINKEYFNI